MKNDREIVQFVYSILIKNDNMIAAVEAMNTKMLLK